LPRLLNAAPSKRARRSNDLLAEYFNLILKSRRQEVYFWRIYFGGGLPLFISAACRVSQTSVRANPPNSEAGLPA
jgi:hypothetical protein